MDKRKVHVNRENISEIKQTDIANINTLIANLSNKDSIVRIRARSSLVALGHQAVQYLLPAINDKDQWVRWEVVKALSQIQDPASVNALVNSLTDKMFDVRWIAAEGLITIGNKSLIPMLRALIDCPDSIWMREGAHHVLHELSDGKFKEILKPVFNALDDIDASLEIAFAAKSALESLQKLQ